MLTRERTILSLLTQVAKPLSRTVFVKLVFLLRHETTLKDVPSFYDFVPYNFGPFSFTLYWELERLRQNGYVTIQEEHVALCEPTLCRTHKEAEELTASTKVAVTEIIRRYGRLSQNALVSDVYHRYPYVGRCYRVTDRSSSIGKALLRAVRSPSRDPTSLAPFRKTARPVGKICEKIMPRLFYSDLTWSLKPGRTVTR